MIPAEDSMRAPWPTFVIFLNLAFALAAQASEPVLREIESSSGLVRISFQPIRESLPDSGTPDPEAAEPGSGIAGIEDFTSAQEMDRDHDALLDVYFLDKGSSEELRFPLKYSDLRAYVSLRPGQYHGGSAHDRTVAMIRDLAGDFRVLMKEPADGKVKP